MFRRPILLSGSEGAEKISSRKALFTWIQTQFDQKDSYSYLIEEYLTGREFLASVCLLPNGSFEPLFVKYLEFGWSNVMYIASGRPIPVLVDSFYNADAEFPNLLKFVERVINVFKPPAPHIFTVQGFQLTFQKDDYVLVELAHRPTGPRSNGVSYKSCGISQETALLMIHIDPSYRPRVDPFWKRPSELQLWFPQRQGVLKHYTTFPNKENVKSSMKVQWLHPPGTVFNDPQNIYVYIAIVTLECKDRKRLLHDAKWLAENWRPELSSL
ncbi:hypothetical protein L596_030808 [Steinernema carpocapsae]|nr:hypothetical protein L596_030808 [Steinernema carpocapsae]